MPIILVVSIIGVYSVNFSTADIWIMVMAGAVGYLLRKFGYEMAPLLLALVLGDRLEENFRLALTMSGGSYATFVDGACIIVWPPRSVCCCWSRPWPGRSATANRSPTRRKARETWRQGKFATARSPKRAPDASPDRAHFLTVESACASICH